jgi:hypothetical protein
VEIDGLDLRLEKNPAGKGNWEDFGGGGRRSVGSYVFRRRQPGRRWGRFRRATAA